MSWRASKERDDGKLTGRNHSALAASSQSDRRRPVEQYNMMSSSSFEEREASTDLLASGRAPDELLLGRRGYFAHSCRVVVRLSPERGG